MQPVTFAIDVNPRFIGMIDIGLSQLIFGCLFKRSQLCKGLMVEIIQRAFTERHVQLIGKVFLNAFVG
jgi:hypothetical protein